MSTPGKFGAPLFVALALSLLFAPGAAFAQAPERPSEVQFETLQLQAATVVLRASDRSSYQWRSDGSIDLVLPEGSAAVHLSLETLGAFGDSVSFTGEGDLQFGEVRVWGDPSDAMQRVRALLPADLPEPDIQLRTLPARPLSADTRERIDELGELGARSVTLAALDEAAGATLTDGLPKLFRDVQPLLVEVAVAGTDSELPVKSIEGLDARYALEVDSNTLVVDTRRAFAAAPGELAFPVTGVADHLAEGVVTVSARGVSGIVNQPSSTLLIRTTDAKDLLTAELRPPNDVPDHPGLLPFIAEAADFAASGSDGFARAMQGTACGTVGELPVLSAPADATSGTSTIRVYFAVTQDFPDTQYGQTVLNAVAFLNAALRRQAIPVLVESVGVDRLERGDQCGESRDCFIDLCDQLVRGVDGLDTIHARRDALDADVAVLLAGDRSWRGLAAGIGIDASRAFIVLSMDGLAANSLGHELTHLAGGFHNPECSTLNAQPAHGWIREDGGEATLMATSCQGRPFRGFRTHLWSSASHRFIDGSSAGDEACCEDMKVFVAGARRMAAFR